MLVNIHVRSQETLSSARKQAKDVLHAELRHTGISVQRIQARTYQGALEGAGPHRRLHQILSAIPQFVYDEAKLTEQNCVLDVVRTSMLANVDATLSMRANVDAYKHACEC
jgi:hypothetical protein